LDRKKGGGRGCVLYCATSPLSLIVPLSHRLVASDIWAKFFLELSPYFPVHWEEK
jgi:hypothetical protein